MAARNHLFELYFFLAGRPTLRFMAQETGLQVSRIFRIMKRDNLKVTEWKKFSALVCAKLGLEKDLLALAEECLGKLERDDLQRILNFMERALFYAALKSSLLERPPALKEEKKAASINAALDFPLPSPEADIDLGIFSEKREEMR